MKKSAAKQKPREEAGQLAIHSASIRNFRGFDDVDLKDIRRVNILVGDNGAGKTSLLESLFAASTNSPMLILQIRQRRGLPAGIQASMDGGGWEYLSRDLFRNYDTGRDVVISIKSANGYSRTLRIFRDSKPVVLSLVNGEGTPKSVRSPISFEWKEGNQKKGTVITPELSLQKDGVGLTIQSTPPPGIRGNFLQGVVHPSAEMLSNLKINGEAGLFLQEIKEQFPDIEDMSVESEYGHSMIFVRQKSRKKLMPVNSVSDGLGKITGVLLSLASLSDGFLFVDELDNGIYFRRHEKFWRQIVEFGKAYNTQLFASVHSAEFLSAALPTMREFPEEFSLTRVYQKDGVGKAAVSSGPDLINLIESGFEIRR